MPDEPTLKLPDIQNHRGETPFMEPLKSSHIDESSIASKKATVLQERRKLNSKSITDLCGSSSLNDHHIPLRGDHLTQTEDNTVGQEYEEDINDRDFSMSANLLPSNLIGNTRENLPTSNTAMKQSNE